MADFCLVKKFMINSWKFVLKIIIEYKNISSGNLIIFFNVSARNNISILMNYIAFVTLCIFEILINLQMRRKVLLRLRSGKNLFKHFHI